MEVDERMEWLVSIGLECFINHCTTSGSQSIWMLYKTLYVPKKDRRERLMSHMNELGACDQVRRATVFFSCRFRDSAGHGHGEWMELQCIEESDEVRAAQT